MAHFAELDSNNDVLNVVVVNNSDVNNLPFPESEPVGTSFLRSLFGENTLWLQTSYNNNFRRQYAEVGGFYYPQLDVFVSPKPYPSWVFDFVSGTWNAPTPKPSVPSNYVTIWNEQYLEWDIKLNEAAI